MGNTTILNNLAECDYMLNEDKKECNEALQDRAKKGSENEIALRFTNNEKSENTETKVSLNLFNKESNDNIFQANNNADESKILASEHENSCEKGCQESELDSTKDKTPNTTAQPIGLNNVTESLENNIEVITTATDLTTQNKDITLPIGLTVQNENTTHKTNLGDTQLTARSEDTTTKIDLSSTKERLEDDTNNTTLATDPITQNKDSANITNFDTQLTAQNDDTTTKTDLTTQNENATPTTSLTAQNENISLQETSKENAPLNHLAEQVSKERELDRRVMDILLAIGISANLHGYYFLKDSIKLAISSPVFIGAITKTMYPTIATMHQTTAFRVERAMRHAIDVSYNKGKIPCLNQIFSLDIFSPYDKPTNAEFIALIADKLKQEFCC